MSLQNTKEGWLIKQGAIVKSWKRRYFVLKGTILEYYEKPGKKQCGTINLNNASSVATSAECKKPYLFKIVIPGSRTYFIAAESEQEKTDWIVALQSAISKAVSRTKGPTEPIEHKISRDDFDILRIIGRGSYGKVQLVRCRVDKKLYAMKSISKRLLEEREKIPQSITERNVLFSTVHPFLVGAHWSFQTEEKI